MGYTQVKEWFWQFIEVWSSVECDECSGMPSMRWNQLMFDRVHSVVLDDRRITITELFDKLGLSFFFGTVHSDGRFAHEMLLSEICPKTADSQAEKDMPCSSQRFAGMC